MTQGPLWSRRALVLFAVTTITFSALGSGVVGASPSSQGSAATVLWPEGENATLSALENVARSTMNATDPLVLGKAPISSFTGERVDPTTSRLRVTTSDGNQSTVLQDHREIDGQGHVVVEVTPEAISPTIELTPGPRTGLALTMYAPPGSLAANGTTAEEKAEDLADDLGLPSTEGWDRASRKAGAQLYGDDRACFEANDDTCEVNATFRVACQSCYQLVRTIPPVPSAELEDGWESGPAVGAPHLNEQRFWFTEEDRLFGVVLFLHVDVDTDQLVDPTAALASLEERIEERGYTIPQAEEKTASAALTFPMPEGKASPGPAEYRWTVGVSNESRESPHDWGSVQATQDARHGEVLDMSFRFVPPQDVSEETSETPGASNGSDDPLRSDDNTTASATPFVGVPALILLAVAATWLARVHRS